jgi:hypothetical protein
MRGFLLDPNPSRQPEFRTRPAVRGTPRVGERLRCENGRWSGQGLRFRFMWGIRSRDPFAPPSAPPTFFPVTPAARETPFFTPRRVLRGRPIACVVFGETDGGVMTARSPYVGPVRGS